MCNEHFYKPAKVSEKFPEIMAKNLSDTLRAGAKIPDMESNEHACPAISVENFDMLF